MKKVIYLLLSVALSVGFTACGGDDEPAPKEEETENSGDENDPDDEDNPINNPGVIDLTTEQRKLVGFWFVENIFSMRISDCVALFPNGLGSMKLTPIHWTYDEQTKTLITDISAPQNIIEVSAIFDNSWSGYFMNLSGKQINLTATTETPLKNFYAREALQEYLCLYRFEDVVPYLPFNEFHKDVISLTYDDVSITAVSERHGTVTISQAWSKQPRMKFKGETYIGKCVL